MQIVLLMHSYATLAQWQRHSTQNAVSLSSNLRGGTNVVVKCCSEFYNYIKINKQTEILYNSIGALFIMSRLILISGKARSGKDTVAEIIKQCLEAHGKKVCILHYADYLKSICKTIYGWNGEKDEYGRSLLQSVGQEFRSIYPHFFVDAVIDLYKVLRHTFDVIIVPDTRYPNEIKRWRKAFIKPLTIRVERYEENGLTQEQKQHMSEVALDKYSFDKVIVNNVPVESLQIVIDRFVKSIIFR